MTDITGERKKLSAQGLKIITRAGWKARQNYTSTRACEVPASTFFLHISVTTLQDDEAAGMRSIEAIGQSRFGSGISYNAASFPSGKLYEGQPLSRRGCHTVNNFRRATCPEHGGSLAAPSWNNNANARALVLPQMEKNAVTDAQIDAAARWAAAQIRSGLAKKTARWHGHRCVTAKACPGAKGYNRIPELQRLTNHYVKVGLGTVVPVEPEKPLPPEIEEEEDMFLGSVLGEADDRVFLISGAFKTAVDYDQFRELRDSAKMPVYDLSAMTLNLWPDKAGTILEARNWRTGASETLTSLIVRLENVATSQADDATAAQVEEVKTRLEELRAELDPEGVRT